MDLYHERDHQDAIKKCSVLLGPELAKEIIPNERERQDVLRRSAHYDLMNPKRIWP